MKPNIRSRAFTLVEVLVVIVILVIITTIATMSYSKFQGDSRDNARKAKASILAEALEKYYQQNGEYPSVAAMTSSSISTLKSKLSITDSDVFVMPGASSNATNSITADEPDRNKIAYNGESENSSEAQQCQTNLNGGCDSFKLEWKDENDSTVEIKSRQAGRPTEQVLTPPATPVLSIMAIAGPALRATASGSVCSGGTLNYKLAVNTTGQSPNWAAVTWTTGSSIQQSSPVLGNTYYFFAIAGCLAGSSGEVISGQAKKSQLYASTGVPIVALSTSGTNLTATATSTTACPAGSTTKYLIQYDIDTVSANGSWTTGQNWTTTNTFTTTAYASSPPRAFNYRAQVRCDDNTSGAQSTPSASSEVATLLTAPAAPTVSFVSTTDKDTKTWQWADVSCPIGTSTEYISTYSRDDSTGWRPYPNDNNASSDLSYSLATNYQGYEYKVKTKSRCSVGEFSSPWSAEGIGPGFIRVVDAPGGATNFVFPAKQNVTSSGHRHQIAKVYWTEPTCGLGTQRIVQRGQYGRAKEDSGTGNAAGATYRFSTNVSTDFDKWATSGSTSSNFLSYYRTASAVTQSEIDSAVTGPSAYDADTWRVKLLDTPTGAVNSSNPWTYEGSAGNYSYMQHLRVATRYACRNLDTKRFAVGPASLSALKTWTGP